MGMGVLCTIRFSILISVGLSCRYVWLLAAVLRLVCPVLGFQVLRLPAQKPPFLRRLVIADIS